MLKIAIITSTRADWGLLSRPAVALQNREDVHLTVLATNMHLLPEHGHTIDEIRRDGIRDIIPVDMNVQGDDDVSRARAMGLCLDAMACTLGQLRPDRVVILGDRYEILAAASAAAMLSIPIIHLHGGEISEGAIDNAMRHAITKLASLHLVSTEDHRQRVIQMGEDPSCVINTGAIGVANALEVPPMSRDEITKSLGGFTLDPDHTFMVTYHPTTLDHSDSVEHRFDALLQALDRHPEYNIIITGANNDAGGKVIADMTARWQARQPERVMSVQSLGMRRYLSTLRNVTAVIGNSSSGIIEVPSMGIPTVDIGSRQRGRTAADSVIHCGEAVDDIDRAISIAISPETRRNARLTDNPYFRPGTLHNIVEAIVNRCPTSTVKKFNDIKF